MKDMEDGSGTGLNPEAARQVATYFARVHGAMLVAAAGESEDAVEELRGHVLEELTRTQGTTADVTRVLAELGAPEALAARYSDAPSDDDAGRIADAESVPLHGRVLGMPYELRLPTASRIASRLWNPLDTRIFVPRVFGLGWDINFGAIAVKLNLIRPDDEDEPFASVPGAVILSTLAVPVLLTAVLAVLVVTAWPTLPAQLPSHWDLVGHPDQFWDRGADVAFLLLMSIVPTLFAAWSHMRARPALNRVAVSALATLLTTISVSQFVQVMFYVRGDRSAWPTFAGLAVGVLAPFLMLVTVSLVGRSAEQRRDLS